MIRAEFTKNIDDGIESGHSHNEIAIAIIVWMEYELGLSLVENGYLDDDPETLERIEQYEPEI